MPKPKYKNKKKKTPSEVEYANNIALAFYDEKLRNNSTLRRSCSDRHIFDDTYDHWRLSERLAGRSIRRVTRSDSIFSLRTKWKLVYAKVVGENVIVWKEDSGDDDDGADSAIGVPKNIVVKDTKANRIAKTIARIRNSRAELETNRNGISIDNVEWETNVCKIGEKIIQGVSVRNDSDIDVLCTVKSAAAKQRGIIIEIEPPTFELPAGSVTSIPFSFLPKRIGITKSIVLFDFAPIDHVVDFAPIDHDDSMEAFSIARYISVRAGNPEDYDIVKPVAPYEKKYRGYDDEHKFSNPIPVRTAPVKTPFVNPLGVYPIPKWVEGIAGNEYDTTIELQALFMGDEGNVESENVDYSSKLTIDNYAECMQTMLWLEEAQMKVDIMSYDLSSASLVREGRYYKLRVPGLAENRPSVIRGDKILIAAASRKFQGLVHRTTQEYAILDLPRSFTQVYIDGLRVDVRFTFSRTTLRTSHQALMVAKNKAADSNLGKILFPKLLDIDNNPPMNPLNTRIIRSSQLNFYNRTLNPEQQSAVVGIVQSTARPAAYLIYGPPGTGKTVTLVESILQTLHASGSNPDSKILVCAPSNTAVDVVVERLAPYVTQREMLRLVAFSRDKASVPDQILEYTNYNEEEDSFSSPDPSTIKGFRIVALTIAYAGKLPNLGLVDHFTHVFIDEAGHSVECEALGSVVLAAKQSTKEPPSVILAGDPKQLGPIIRHDIAKKFGLEKSMLERISEMEPYSRNDETDFLGNHYDKRMITKLVHNYRSHPSILDLPNKTFYDGDLIAEADVTRSHRFAGWEHLVKPGFPLIFHGVEGEDMRESNSPSWFNPDECAYVKMYVDLLVRDTKRNKCKPEEIGIIAPYHKQVQKIRMLLNAHGYSDCKVGSVEEFQGSERPVIIISTVRSTVDHISFDVKHKLGFLSNEKRFNVAITRAQSLLIMIGNPFTLENDPNWKSMIEYVVDGGGYTGVEYTKKELRNDDTNDIQDEFDGIRGDAQEKRKNIEADDGFLMVSHVTAQEGPAWRSEE